MRVTSRLQGMMVAGAEAFAGAPGSCLRWHPSGVPLDRGCDFGRRGGASTWRRGGGEAGGADRQCARRAPVCRRRRHPIAQWKLGRMYAEGDGVIRDNLRAFDYLSKIANTHAEASPAAPQARVVANAFVSRAVLSRRHSRDACESRRRAGARDVRLRRLLFWDATAQYHLGRMYLEGRGAPKDPKYAARWLGLAATKGQYQAQALGPGQMLFYGQSLPKQAARGLMWLTLARDGAGASDTWIKEAYAAAINKASEDDRAMALKLLERWVQGRRD